MFLRGTCFSWRLQGWLTQWLSGQINGALGHLSCLTSFITNTHTHAHTHTHTHLHVIIWGCLQINTDHQRFLANWPVTRQGWSVWRCFSGCTRIWSSHTDKARYGDRCQTLRYYFQFLGIWSPHSAGPEAHGAVQLLISEEPTDLCLWTVLHSYIFSVVNVCQYVHVMYVPMEINYSYSWACGLTRTTHISLKQRHSGFIFKPWSNR